MVVVLENFAEEHWIPAENAAEIPSVNVGRQLAITSSANLDFLQGVGTRAPAPDQP